MGGELGAFQRGTEVPGIGVVEKVPGLVELHDQLDVAEDVRVGALDRGADGAKVIPAEGVGIAAVELADGVFLLLPGPVHAPQLAVLLHVVHGFDGVVQAVRGRRGEPVVLQAKQDMDPSRVLFPQPQDLRAVIAHLLRRHGDVVIVRRTVLGKAYGVEAQAERGLYHLLGGISAVGERGMAVNIGPRDGF